MMRKLEKAIEKLAHVFSQENADDMMRYIEEAKEIADELPEHEKKMFKAIIEMLIYDVLIVGLKGVAESAKKLTKELEDLKEVI